MISGRLGTIFTLSLGILPSLVSHGLAQESEWEPTDNVEIVLLASAGGAFGRHARTMQKILEDECGVDTSTTVVPKPGGGGAVAAAYINQHPGNGHYVMLVSNSLLSTPLLGNSDISYRDVTPIAKLFDEWVGFAVASNSSIESGADLISRLKSDPQSLSYGFGASRGGSFHMALGAAMRDAGVNVPELKAVVFESTGKAAAALMGGHVDYVGGPASFLAGHKDAGRVRMLAVSSPERLGGELADVPTWTEQGVESVFPVWRGVIGPQGLTEEQQAYWEEVFTCLNESAAWQDWLEQNMATADLRTGDEFDQYLAEEEQEIGEILTMLGLEVAAASGDDAQQPASE